MARSKDANQIVAFDLQGAIFQINFALARLSDRLDKLEGIRDSFESQSGGAFAGTLTNVGKYVVKDSDGNEIHSLG